VPDLLSILIELQMIRKVLDRFRIGTRTDPVRIAAAVAQVWAAELRYFPVEFPIELLAGQGSYRVDQQKIRVEFVPKHAQHDRYAEIGGDIDASQL